MEDKSTSITVGKSGVKVDAGKGKPGGGTQVNVGGKGVGVNTGKPGKRTNVGIGKGGVSVSTDHKGKPVYDGVKPEPSPFLYLYAATEDQLHDNHNIALFFTKKDMASVKRMNLHFTKSTNAATFLPRQIAESIPFSSNKFPEILKQFSVKPNSMEAEIMRKTIKECKEPGIK
uniref:BURP domain-containing protein n=1 Tax=Davidia involucrata TaxID=16924 RepID=A0A5B7BG63_DAVIN